MKKTHANGSRVGPGYLAQCVRWKLWYRSNPLANGCCYMDGVVLGRASSVNSKKAGDQRV
jgi:hypothetical protein